MAGVFEVFVDGESCFRFRLKAPDGTIMAVSAAYDDKAAAVAGIAAVRECAGTGLITDLCPAAAVKRPAAEGRPAAHPQQAWHRRAGGFHPPAGMLRRVAAPRRSGSA